MLLALVDDNVHFCGLAASAGGRDSSWTCSGVSFLIINLGRVTKSLTSWPSVVGVLFSSSLLTLA